jgi:REP element-mobilizing transposase RayT
MSQDKSPTTEPPLIHNRGYLPHIEGADYQMITYRLNDAIPVHAYERFKGTSEKNKREKFEEAMDAGFGNCWLKRPEVATLILENWRRFDAINYELVAFVIMPNHVHVLIRVFENARLSSIVHSWKSYTSKKIVALLTEAGESPCLPFWQTEYWDRYIRNQSHFNAAVAYIENNPVKAGLVASANQWAWSSAAKTTFL